MPDDMNAKFLDVLRCELMPSPQQARVIDARNTYVDGVSDDDLLHGFRRAAGMAAPGKSMGGWCSGNSGVLFGQVISGLANLGAATADAAAREKSIRLFEQWQATAGADGDAKMGTYAWDKMVGAMVDLAVQAEYQPAMDYLKKSTAWAAEAFDRSQSPASAVDWDGRRPAGTLEWYTLGENLYRAYLLTGDTHFREFADIWRYDVFWELFNGTSTPASAHSVHAYSHVNSLCSLAAAYEVHREPRDLSRLINAATYITQTQCYATGGYGPWERLVSPVGGQLGRALDLCCDHAEVGCGSWAVFKLGTYLLRFTRDPKWGDWIERVLYNLIGAALPVRPDGRTTYYADYRPSGGMKIYYDSAWPCCGGTYLQSVVAAHDLVYLLDTDSREIYVSLFLPSETRFKMGEKDITLRQETDYPVQQKTRLVINCSSPTEFAVMLRVPQWCMNATATLANGETVGGAAGEWLRIKRTWCDGDVVDLELPAEFELRPVDSFHPHRTAVVRGPLVYAQLGRYARPISLSGSADELLSRIKPDAEGRPLWFTCDAPGEAKDLTCGFLRPIYDYPEAGPYRLYVDLDQPFIY